MNTPSPSAYQELARRRRRQFLWVLIPLTGLALLDFRFSSDPFTSSPGEALFLLGLGASCAVMVLLLPMTLWRTHLRKTRESASR